MKPLQHLSLHYQRVSLKLVSRPRPVFACQTNASLKGGRIPLNPLDLGDVWRGGITVMGLAAWAAGMAAWLTSRETQGMGRN